MSSVNSTSRSAMRLSGLVSGMDTDTVIKQMLAGDTAKINKLKASLQVDEWKTEAYREVTSKLQAFYSTYFDPLSATNLKSENSFSSFSTSYAQTTSSSYVTLTGGTTAKAGTYTISKLVAAKAATLTGVNVSKAVEGGTIDTVALAAMSSSNNKLSITLNGTTKEISLPTNGSIINSLDLKDTLQVIVNSEFGAGRIAVNLNAGNDGIAFSSSSTDIFSINSSGTANTVLGLASSNLSNKIDLNAKLSSLTNSLSTGLTTGAGNTVAFKINDASFSFDATKTSIQDVLNAVNAEPKANATMKYDITTNSFDIKSSNTGAAESLTVSNTTGNLLNALGINATLAKGTDASVTVNDGTSTKTITRSTNSFTYDGMTYNIKQDFTSDTDSSTAIPDPIVASVVTDTTKSFDFIKGFVDKYNELIDSINNKLSEERDREYVPLTDEQKEAMTDDQVTSWEKRAKSGLLKNDSILSGIVTKLRTALYDTVESAGISLSSIGITTSSDYTQKGKLQINADKLKTALASKGEQITKLFTTASDTTYYDAINSTTKKSQRYKESGIAQRLSDVIQDAVRTNTDNKGNKGLLLDKAGLIGDRSEYTNLLFKEMEGFAERISELNDKLSDREKALYAKFSAMETALSKLNEQQSYITSMLGGSQ